jgi:hypothetical protein
MAVKQPMSGWGWKLRNITPILQSDVSVVKSTILNRELMDGKANGRAQTLLLSLLAPAWNTILQSCTTLPMILFGTAKYFMREFILKAEGAMSPLVMNMLIFLHKIAFSSGSRGGYLRINVGLSPTYMTQTLSKA